MNPYEWPMIARFIYVIVMMIMCCGIMFIVVVALSDKKESRLKRIFRRKE